jgi:DNA-binding helix-hairpin-helix protein with protein kinase domain
MSKSNFDDELQKNLKKIAKRQKEKRERLKKKYNNMPEEEKNELKAKLKKKIEMKQQMRMSKFKKENTKINHKLTPGNNSDIYTATALMKKDVEKLQKEKLNILQMDKMLTTKYQFLKDKYFAIYRAILRNELPLEVLISMLKQKDRVEREEISEEKASLEMGSMFAKKLNVDVDALVKSGMENKKKMEG